MFSRKPVIHRRPVHQRNSTSRGKTTSAVARPLDKGLLLVALFLIGFGVVQVYSSSFIYAIENYNDGLHFFRRQGLFALLAIGVMVTTAYLPYGFWRKTSWLLWLFAVCGVAATLVPGLGVKVGGAYRWLQLPMGFRFEPGELLKVTYPLIAAYWLAKEDSRAPWPITLAKLFIVLSPMALLLKQPDFGTFIICGSVTFLLFFAFGLRWRYILAGLTAAVPALYFLVVSQPYRLKRIEAFLDPWSDPEAKGFQVIQSMLSFHAGGVFGAGLGLGQGKLFFLPEAHNDFTLAVLGEELGFVGVVFVLVLYGFLVFRGLQITVRSQDRFSQVVALGSTLIFAFSVFINSGVAMGLLPPKGMSLPFLSYGGSSLLCTSIGVGLLLNIDRHSLGNKKAFAGYKI